MSDIRVDSMKSTDSPSDIRWPDWYWPVLCGLAFYGMQCIQFCLILSNVYKPPGENATSRMAQIPSYCLRIGFLMLVLYGLFILIRNKDRIKSVLYLLVPALIFWTFYTARLIYENYIDTNTAAHDLIFYLHPFTMLLLTLGPMTVLASGLQKKSAKSAFYFVFIPVILINLLLLYFLRDYLYQCMNGEAGIHDAMAKLGMPTWRIREIALFGYLLSVLSLWTFIESKLKACLFWPLYVSGNILLCSTGTKTFLLSLFLAHLFVLLFSSFLRTKHRVLFLAMLLIANLAVLYACKNVLFQRSRHDVKNVVAIIDDYSTTYGMKNENAADKKSETGAPDLPTSIDRKIPPEKVAGTIPRKDWPKPPERFESARELYAFIMKHPDSRMRLGSGRVFLWWLGFQQVWEHPFTGTGTLVHGMLPHNAVVEAFVATGILGGTAYLFVLFLGACDAVALIRKYPSLGWLSVILVTELIAQFFVGTSIRYHHTLWFALAIVRGTLYFHRNDPGERERPEITPENQAAGPEQKHSEEPVA